ncbi:kinase-like protein [Ceratobasidium sp. AG-I]|nr:kinase-like protein [Ceratobasidium sp. AG-I]
MVSPWNKRGNVMKYMEEKPDLDRYALCTQLVNAVVYLHESDVIHGDLKGDNILVSEDGTIQLTDFGLTIMHDAMIQFSKSEDWVGGTLRWMAPELVFGVDGGLAEHTSQPLSETLTRAKESKSDTQAAKLCKETDVYALGMTMLELITGKPPFKEIERNAAVILALAKGKRPHRPNKILDQSHRGVPFWEILQKCWAQTPADRLTVNQVEALVSLNHAKCIGAVRL